MKIVFNPYYLGILVLTVGKNKSILPVRYSLIDHLKKDGFWNEKDKRFKNIIKRIEFEISGINNSIESDTLYKEFLNITSEEELKEKYPELFIVFEILFKMREFQSLESINIEYIEALKNEWKNNNKIGYLLSLLNLGIKASDLDIDVIVVPPYFEKTFCSNGNISLACSKNPDKVLISLTNEILHYILPSLPDRKENQVRSAIIELLAENEINRVTYKESYGTLIANKGLSDIIDILKTDFIEYLDNHEETNILEFEKLCVERITQSVRRGA